MEVASLADTTLVLVAPGTGDAVQAAKAGILEVGDIFVVNKCDNPGAQETVRNLRTMIAMAARGGGDWKPPIVMTTATAGEGIADLTAALDAHWSWLDSSGERDRRRRARAREEVAAIAVAALRQRMGGLPGDSRLTNWPPGLPPGSSIPIRPRTNSSRPPRRSGPRRGRWRWRLRGWNRPRRRRVRWVPPERRQEGAMTSAHTRAVSRLAGALLGAITLLAAGCSAAGGARRPRADPAVAAHDAVAVSPSGRAFGGRAPAATGPISGRPGSGSRIAWAPSLPRCSYAGGHRGAGWDRRRVGTAGPHQPGGCRRSGRPGRDASPGSSARCVRRRRSRPSAHAIPTCCFPAVRRDPPLREASRGPGPGIPARGRGAFLVPARSRVSARTPRTRTFPSCPEDPGWLAAGCTPYRSQTPLPDGSVAANE